MARSTPRNSLKKHDAAAESRALKARRSRVTTQVRKDKRREAVQSKRRRLMSSDDTPLTGRGVGELVRILADAGSDNHQERFQVLKEMRVLLATHEHDYALVETIIESGIVPIMVNLLNSASPLASATRTGGEVYREILWCLTNIASGQYEHTKLVLPAVPRLLQFLEGGGALAEHAVWVLGNIAADCEEFRQQLIASGAVGPLVQQLNQSATGAPELAKLCAWALSNLARGYETPTKPFIDAGIVPVLAAGLVQGSAHSFNEATVVEVAWLLSFLTAKDEECLKLLLENGLVEWLLPYFATANDLLLTPTLRVFGNVCCGSMDHHTDEWQMPYVERLLRADSPFLQKLSEFLQAGTVAAGAEANAPVANANLAAESAWVLSNLATLDARVVERIIQAQFLPLLAYHFHNSAFEVKREVAFTLANIALTSPAHLDQVLKLDALPGFMRLLSVADVAVVGNSLRFIENVLRVVPRGDTLVESLEGIDALEKVQYESNEEHLSRWAAALVNEFYGENYGVNSPPSAAGIGATFSADSSSLEATTFSFGADNGAAPAGAGGRGRGAHMTTPAWKNLCVLPSGDSHSYLAVREAPLRRRAVHRPRRQLAKPSQHERQRLAGLGASGRHQRRHQRDDAVRRVVELAVVRDEERRRAHVQRERVGDEQVAVRQHEALALEHGAACERQRADRLADEEDAERSLSRREGRAGAWRASEEGVERVEEEDGALHDQQRVRQQHAALQQGDLHHGRARAWTRRDL